MLKQVFAIVIKDFEVILFPLRLDHALSLLPPFHHIGGSSGSNSSSKSLAQREKQAEIVQSVMQVLKKRERERGDREVSKEQRIISNTHDIFFCSQHST